MQVKQNKEALEARIDLTPMIDTVMFLLIFFMVVTNFSLQEADISFALPGIAAQAEAVEIPDEQIIQITNAGNVFLNDLEYDPPGLSDMPLLVKTLTLFRQTAQANKVPAMITVAPEDEIKHQRVVDVLNACASAGISNVTFAAIGEDS